MKKAILILLVTMMIFSSLNLNVLAANACYSISGNSNASKTFYATTDNWWLTNAKITIKQSKGSAKKDDIKGGGTYSTYSYFTVTVSDGKNYRKTYKMTGSSVKVKLPKRNTRYSITVKPGNRATMKISMGSKNRWFNGWYNPAKWTVTKTKHVYLCH